MWAGWGSWPHPEAPLPWALLEAAGTVIPTHCACVQGHRGATQLDTCHLSLLSSVHWGRGQSSHMCRVWGLSKGWQQPRAQPGQGRACTVPRASAGFSGWAAMATLPAAASVTKGDKLLVGTLPGTHVVGWPLGCPLQQIIWGRVGDKEWGWIGSSPSVRVALLQLCHAQSCGCVVEMCFFTLLSARDPMDCFRVIWTESQQGSGEQKQGQQGFIENGAGAVKARGYTCAAPSRIALNLLIYPEKTFLGSCWFFALQKLDHETFQRGQFSVELYLSFVPPSSAVLGDCEGIRAAPLAPAQELRVTRAAFCCCLQSNPALFNSHCSSKQCQCCEHCRTESPVPFAAIPIPKPSACSGPWCQLPAASQGAWIAWLGLTPREMQASHLLRSSCESSWVLLLERREQSSAGSRAPTWACSYSASLLPPQHQQEQWKPGLTLLLNVLVAA